MILVLNSGSSSFKLFLYQFTSCPDKPIPPIGEALAQWGSPHEDISLHIKTEEKELSLALPVKISFEEVLMHCLQALAPQTSPSIYVIGHRIVHGGNEYTRSVRIDGIVRKKLSLFSELAPLHNPAALRGIDVLQHLFPKIPHIAVFDTAFHHTLPPEARYYPGPYSWIEAGIRRFGFHGINFHYCSWRASQLLHQDSVPLKLVVCHLGAGASLCAIKGRTSIDTTMGFTPLDGLMMNTRCGSVDPGILLYRLKTISIEQLEEELYRQSGLLGISGFSSTFSEIFEKVSQGDERAKLAIDLYHYRLRSLISSMIASLGGIDALVFTGGIGENVPALRQRVCDDFSFLGIEMDKEKNSHPHAEDCILSSSKAKVQVLLIHAQEAFEIARECWNYIPELKGKER